MSNKVQSDLDLFIEETREILQNMQVVCADQSGALNYQQVFEQIERGIHTIKGNALAFGFQEYHLAAQEALKTIRASKERPDFAGLSRDELTLVLNFIVRSREFMSQITDTETPPHDYFQEIIDVAKALYTPPPPVQEAPSPPPPPLEASEEEVSWKQEVEEILANAPRVDPQLAKLAEMAAAELARESGEAQGAPKPTPLDAIFSEAAAQAPPPAEPLAAELPAIDPSAIEIPVVEVPAVEAPMAEAVAPEPPAAEAPAMAEPAPAPLSMDEVLPVEAVMDQAVEVPAVPERLTEPAIDPAPAAVEIPVAAEPAGHHMEAEVEKPPVSEDLEAEMPESELLAIEALSLEKLADEPLTISMEGEMLDLEFPADDSLELEPAVAEVPEPAPVGSDLEEQPIKQFEIEADEETFEIDVDEATKDQPVEEPDMQTEVTDKTVTVETTSEQPKTPWPDSGIGAREEASHPASSMVYGYAFEAWCLADVARKLGGRFQSTDWELAWGLPRIAELLSNFSQWGVESRRVPLGEYLMNTGKWVEDMSRTLGSGLVVNVSGEDIHVMPQVGEFISLVLREVVSASLPGSHDGKFTATALLFDFGKQQDTGRIQLRVSGLPALTRTTMDLKIFDIKERLAGVGGSIARGPQQNEIMFELPEALHCIDVLVARTGERAALGIPWHRIVDVAEQAPPRAVDSNGKTWVDWKGRKIEVMDLREVPVGEERKDGGCVVFLRDGAGVMGVQLKGVVQPRRDVLVEHMPPIHAETMIFGACITVEDGRRIPLLIPGRYSKEGS